MEVNGDSILAYRLQWVMIYSFGINTEFGNRSQTDLLLWNFFVLRHEQN